jgi:hypothetical protein
MSEVSELLSLEHLISLQALESNRKAFGQATLWKILVDLVFHTGSQDILMCKDL